MQSNKVVVVKVPRKVEPVNQPQVFPRMPRLYLELIENKRKIKQDLINKEFVHASPSPSPERDRRSQTRSPSENDKYKHRLSPESDDERTVVSDDDQQDDRRRYRSMRSSNDSDSESDRESKRVKNDRKEERDGNHEEDRADDREEEREGEGHRDEVRNDSEKEDEEHKPKEKDADTVSVVSLEDDHKTISEPASPDLTKRLTELLDDSDAESVKPVKEKKKNKYSIQRDRHGRSISRVNTAPSYAELEAKGAYVPKKEFRDMNSVTQSEKVDEDLKRELLFKFELLRKSYPTAVIPTFSIHTEYKQMLNSYEDCVRRLSLDSNVESYKQYLIYGFMGCEFFLGKFLKFDMEGFTQQQIISMSSYDKLLIELGEKSYMPEGSKWPVELRLLFLIIMNAAFFVISKMIMKKTGANIMNMVNNMTSKFGGGSGGESKEAPKRKMKGPTIDLEEIPDF